MAGPATETTPAGDRSPAGAQQGPHGRARSHGERSVLQVIGSLAFGGAEMLVVELAERLVARGWRCGVAVHGACDDQLKARLQACGVQVVDIGSFPAAAYRLAAEVRAGGYGVVNAHLFPALYTCALARTLRPGGARWIYTEHSTNNRRRAYRALSRVERLAYAAFDLVICVSTDVKQSLERWTGPHANQVVIANGVEFNRFDGATPADRAEFGAVPGDVLVLMVGAFRPEKNQASLVQSFARLPGNFRLVLAGDGPTLEESRRIAHSLGIADRVNFLGLVRNPERLMRAADIYVLPSFYEGLALSALEAAAAGCPIVYSDVPGLSSLFEGAGMPVDPHSPESIADGIRAVGVDAALRAGLARKAAVVAAAYDIEHTVDGYASAYAGEWN